MIGRLNRLFARLRADQRGNVMMLTAASLLAMIAMGGGALDMSRLYLVKSRLQQACDAGVLAYRRSMQGTTVTDETRKTALAFFNANFTPGKYGTTATSFPEPTVDAKIVVHGAASTVVPMSLMRVFGDSDRTLAVTCDAQLQLPNTDVMFVLDTTGSMADQAPGGGGSKIAVLRDAVLNFYKTLENVKIGGTQVRYGFVPYSSTVNVGMLLKREWMVDNAQYQSRQFDGAQTDPDGKEGDTTTSWSGWSPPVTPTTSTSYGSAENCVAPANTYSETGSSSAWSPSGSDVPRSRTDYRTISGDIYYASINGNGQCVITKQSYPTTSQQQTETVSKNPNAGNPKTKTSNYFRYEQHEYPVLGFKGAAANGLMAGGKVPFLNVNAPINGESTGSVENVTWGGSSACIEERKAPWDMDVDTIPTGPDTQWRPFLPAIVFARAKGDYNSQTSGWSFAAQRTTNGYVRLSSAGSLYNACPSPSRKLQTKEAGLTQTALQNYLNALSPRGLTYHDIGFLWGLRLISKDGLFKAENTTAPNAGAITRNIIFMTDGDTDTDLRSYEAYGLAALDRRRTDPASQPTEAQQDDDVENRLTKYCKIAKEQKGITVWVIAFGTSLTPLLTNCASTGRAFEANNAAELNKTFAEIAAKIAQLRLTK